MLWLLHTFQFQCSDYCTHSSSSALITAHILIPVLWLLHTFWFQCSILHTFQFQCSDYYTHSDSSALITAHIPIPVLYIAHIPVPVLWSLHTFRFQRSVLHTFQIIPNLMYTAHIPTPVLCTAHLSNPMLIVLHTFQIQCCFTHKKTLLSTAHSFQFQSSVLHTHSSSGGLKCTYCCKNASICRSVLDSVLALLQTLPSSTLVYTFHLCHLHTFCIGTMCSEHIPCC